MKDTNHSKKSHVLGTNHTNNKANKNGLDEIDLWAMGIGQSERSLKDMRPKKRHLCSIS